MMADIYKIHPDRIIGGPGRLVVKPYDGRYPEKISDVMEPTEPYNLKPGWRDLGATTDGIKTSRSFDTDEFEVDQVGVVDTYITKWEHTLETQLAENTVENRQLALAGGTIMESAPVFGDAVTLQSPVDSQAAILSLESCTFDFKEGGWLQIGTETKRIKRIMGTTIYLAEPLTSAYPAHQKVIPVIELGTKRIGYGTLGEIPFMTYALISQKKDGTLYMCVIRKAKISGDEVEQTYSKEKRVLPLQLSAFPVDGVAEEENVYYEIEEIR